MKITHYFSEQYRMLKTDTIMNLSFYIHLLISLFHLAYALLGNGTELKFCINSEWHFFVRSASCFVIAISTFFFQRKGFSITLLIYGYILIYINSFYNYTSFLFCVFAVYATPKIINFALIAYALNCFASFALREYGVISLGLHALNCGLFYICSKYLLSFKTPDKLVLTDDETFILKELSDGKMQKEIDLYSQTTITKKLRDAKERNLCKSTNELIMKFLNERKLSNTNNLIPNQISNNN